MKLVDFHMHTTHSDGSYTPRELMRFCKLQNLSCVSVTDHDTMSSFEEAKQEAKALEIELVPGVEISAKFEPGTLHILGYFLDPSYRGLQECFEEVQTARRERNPQLIEKLNRVGVEITLEEVVEESSRRAGRSDSRQIGRPHFAQVLVKKGYAKSLGEAFRKYLAKGSPAYVDKRRLSSETAIRVINEAGGIASVAHPRQMRLDSDMFDERIGELVDQGLGALEVHHSSHDDAERQTYAKIAERYDLVATGGSDFHGSNKPEVHLGYLGKNVRMGYEMVDALRKKIEKRS